MGGGTSLSSHRAGFGVFWSKGFTLAEVLITLAIIGIVAALTIPTLVQNYQTKAWILHRKYSRENSVKH